MLFSNHSKYIQDMTSILTEVPNKNWENHLPHMYNLGNFLIKKAESTKEKILQVVAWIFTIVPVLPVIALVWDGILLGLPHLRARPIEVNARPDLEFSAISEKVPLSVPSLPDTPEIEESVVKREVTPPAEPTDSHEPASLDETIDSFQVSTLMKVILAGAAVLATTAAVWYFRDSIIPDFSSSSSQNLPSLRPNQLPPPHLLLQRPLFDQMKENRLQKHLIFLKKKYRLLVFSKLKPLLLHHLAL